ncbi:MAG: dipicolinate synthase subunit B [Bacillota bacterium]|nr:dipicolinate synthase subunit B [Bacillota bacterium]
MTLTGKRVGWGITGSLCNLHRVWPQFEKLVAAGAEVVPVVSRVVQTTDSRFGAAAEIMDRIRAIAGREPIRTIAEAETLGPAQPVDIMVVVPCTGNTMARIANAITDGPVTMAVKATLRNGRPVLLAISTNDALGLNARNLGTLLAARGIFFVPFGQDNPWGKPTSLDADLELLLPAMEEALQGRQIQPLLVTRHRGGPPGAVPYAREGE